MWVIVMIYSDAMCGRACEWELLWDRHLLCKKAQLASQTFGNQYISNFSL